MVIPSSIKSCLSSSICQLGPITMNYGKVKARSHLACCTGDDCRTISVSRKLSFSLYPIPSLSALSRDEAFQAKSSPGLFLSFPHYNQLQPILFLPVPPEDDVPNGYQCPACYSVDSFQCGDEIVNCTGSETQCVDLAGLMNSGNCLLFGAVFHLFG